MVGSRNVFGQPFPNVNGRGHANFKDHVSFGLYTLFGWREIVKRELAKREVEERCCISLVWCA